MPNTVKIKNYSDKMEEIVSAGAIYPGMLVERTSSNTVQAHSTAGGNVLQMFACEDALQGNGLNDAYASGDPVQVWFPARGDQVYAILADDNDVSIGDELESDGNGYLQKHVADNSAAPNVTNQIVAKALEAVDTLNSSAQSSASPLVLARRIIVEVV